MRRMMIASLLIAPLAALPADAQDYRRPYDRPSDSYGVGLVNTCIHQYLGRAPNQQDIAFGRMIDQGTRDPATELAGILGSDEFFNNRAGGDLGGFLKTVFQEVANRRPSPREWDRLMDRLRDDPTEGGRTAMVLDLLQQFPPALPAPPDRFDDRPGRPRYNPPDRDWR